MSTDTASGRESWVAIVIGSGGATVELVADVSHGTLTLSPDGSFTYMPGASFDVADTFVPAEGDPEGVRHLVPTRTAIRNSV